MCGRYASSRTPEDLAEEFDVRDVRIPAPLDPDYNVAPTKEVYAVLERERRPDAHPPPASAGPDEEPTPDRQLRVVTWGLVPSWAKDRSIGNRMINARMETVAEKPAYKRAFAKRRCLLPADGYFEWYPTQERTKAGKPRKQPFFIRPRDHGVLAMAGLYELWRDRDRADDDPARWLWTCTVITTEAEDSLGRIHDRMPLMVPRDRWSQWLDPHQPADTLLDLLEPAAPGALEAYPVSTLVSNVRNNGPELLEPLPLEDVPGDVLDEGIVSDRPGGAR
jgi:putative SOS response-associated peptidase YedK